jgi:hypothetical protein
MTPLASGPPGRPQLRASTFAISRGWNIPHAQPDGSVGIDDILAEIGKFQGVDNAPLTWLDIASSQGSDLPNQAIDIGDILATIAGFQGDEYPGDGPLGCP